MIVEKHTKKYQPKMKEFFFLPEIRGSRANPDGTKVAYGVLTPNLKVNRFEQFCNIFDVVSGETFRLTQSPYCYGIRWLSTDSLVLLQQDNDNHFQVFLYRGLIGDGQQITFHPGGVRSFELFKKGILFIGNNPEKDPNAHKLANYIHFEEEESASSIYYTNFQKALEYQSKIIQFTGDENNPPVKPVIEISKLFENRLSLQQIKAHSDSNTIFVQCQTKDNLNFNLETSYFKITIDSDKALEEFLASKDQEIITRLGKITELALPKGSRLFGVSPIGNKLLFGFPERDLKQYTFTDLWILDLEKAKNNLNDLSTIKDNSKCITRDFDYEPLTVFWTNQGIFTCYWNESTREIASISEEGKISVLDLQALNPGSSFIDFSENGWLSLCAGTSTKIIDSYLAQLVNGKITSIQKITNSNEKFTHWDFGSVESIRWKSKDGTEIEGILRKPSNFNPKKKYPLIFFNHGGPSHSSANLLLSSDDLNFYPTIQFSHKDILILMVNYRGSLGRGQWFHELGVDNLGVGDMWDIESALDYLLEQGFVDDSKIGAMGWSQGGFISAYLGMHSSRFTAVSCGASVSSWYTYYISSDLRHSLNISGNPTEPGMMEIYQKTAPISGIQTAQTPMLLQHGENDQRISVVSAHELHRSLKDKGIQTELFIFPGMGHGLNKPRETFAALVQNYRWFMHHFFGEELDFTKDDSED
ncbi:MAG TPA: prolyl oligopeptidase family serine peptidase [Candidatus Glassbacteria bacterium]|nr:prolyl oligopeptidase family serine peptidase [Candidatus Glassbacteria bacterium]